MRNLLLWATYYHFRFGFNITHIIPEYNEILGKKSPYKSSTNDRTKLRTEEQNYSDIVSFEWDRTKALGTVTGFNNLRALDFDNLGLKNGNISVDTVLGFINIVLEMLELPYNYEWVVKSGSNDGFHIIFYSQEHTYTLLKNKIKAFLPNKDYALFFKRLDLIWNNHLILPPSLHKTQNRYSFMFCDMPINKPLYVDIETVNNCIHNLCYENGGFNTKFSKNNTTKYYDHKIDLSVIVIDNESYINTLSQDIKEYYANIANSIDNVYKKNHYRTDLKNISNWLKKEFSNKTIIDIACGTGFWTQKISEIATSVMGIDVNESCIELAKSRHYPRYNVFFEIQDIFNIKIKQKFDCIFGGSIYSHIKIEDLGDFIKKVSDLAKIGGSIVFIDNRYSPSNGLKIDQTDDFGNTYQVRYAKNSDKKYLIIKNYPTISLLEEILGNNVKNIEFIEYEYFWLLRYKIFKSKMKKQFVCLANSYKGGGRCVAGIVLENGNPVMQDGIPKWIRPVCKTAHGEVPTRLVSHINLLDIVEIDVTSNVPDSYQTENVLFDTNAINVVGKFSLNNLSNLCDNSQTTLFGNKGSAVTPENAQLLSNSLRMIKVTNFTVVEITYEDNPNPKLRLSFTFNGNSYVIPITDPIFLNAYKSNKNLLSNSSDVFVVMSLGVLHENWHSKLVAGIIIK